MNAHVILNPTAGQVVSRTDLDRALDYLASHGWTLVAHESSAPGDTTRLAAAAAAAGADAVIAVGGDGTLSEAANGLAGTETALGLLPSGTGNVWAAQIGLVASPTLLHRPDPLAAARALVAGRRHAIDLGVARTVSGQRYFVLWAGVGLDAIITRVIEGEGKPVKRRFGQLAYIWAGARPVLEFRGTRAKIRLDERRERGRVVFVVISNIQYYAGIQLAPDARADDGWLDICVFEGRSWVDTLRHIVQLAFRRHLADPQVTIHRAREVAIHTDPLLPVHCDGDPIGATPLTVSVAPQALHVLVPAASTGFLAYPERVRTLGRGNLPTSGIPHA